MSHENTIHSRQSKFKQQHHKTPSIRDLMLGKKVVKSLPENFFEKILDLELKLKREFQINILQELVSLYSTAIEYYESNDDNKYKDYQNRLNSLLTQPEILKRMSNPVKIDSKREQVKKRIKLKTEMNEVKSHRVTVKNLIQDVEKGPIRIGDIVNDEIDRQNQNFKKLMEEKRKKSLLSTSDVTEQIEVIKNKRTDEIGNKNRSFILENNIDITTEVDNNSNILDNIDNSFEKILEKSNLDDIEENFNLNESQVRNKKQKEVLTQLKGNTERFINQFNNYFYEDIFQLVVNEIEKILEEKNEKKLEISKNYNGQIKEMEFLLNSDSEETYKESFKGLIESLKDEQQLEIDKLEDHYASVLADTKSKFRLEGIRKNPGITLLEERFRLDMLNSINNVFKKK